jgi:hypothetical protein
MEVSLKNKNLWKCRALSTDTNFNYHFVQNCSHIFVQHFRDLF